MVEPCHQVLFGVEKGAFLSQTTLLVGSALVDVIVYECLENGNEHRRHGEWNDIVVDPIAYASGKYGYYIEFGQVIADTASYLFHGIRYLKFIELFLFMVGVGC